MATTMQRWVVASAGHFDNLSLQECTPPEPSDGQILVAVRSVGLNMADVFAILGLYSATPQGSFTPGLEFAGDIVKMGPGTGSSGFSVGDRVMGCTRFGGYATMICVGTEYLRKIPQGWDYDQGAAFLAQCLTAWYGLIECARLRSYQSPVVLIHSAAGGVGLFAVELVQQLGGKVIATVGNEQKINLLVDRYGLTREQVIVRSGGGQIFAQQLKKALSSIGENGIDIVFDSLLGDYMQPAYQCLRRRGHLVVFGAASMTPHGNAPGWPTLAWQWLKRPKLDPLQMISENKSVTGFNLIWLWDMAGALSPILEDMMQSVQWQPPHVGHTFAFDKAQEAARALQSGSTTGKVCLQKIIQMVPCNHLLVLVLGHNHMWWFYRLGPMWSD